MYFIFPPHLTCTSALPGETGNPKIASFRLDGACFLPKTRNTLKYHQVTAEPSFTVKTIVWMQQRRPRSCYTVARHSISQSINLRLLTVWLGKT